MIRVVNASFETWDSHSPSRQKSDEQILHMQCFSTCRTNRIPTSMSNYCYIPKYLFCIDRTDSYPVVLYTYLGREKIGYEIWLWRAGSQGKGWKSPLLHWHPISAHAKMEMFITKFRAFFSLIFFLNLYMHLPFLLWPLYWKRFQCEQIHRCSRSFANWSDRWLSVLYLNHWHCRGEIFLIAS